MSACSATVAPAELLTPRWQKLERDQLVEFERIYNYRSKKGGRLYFSDYMRNRGENVRDYSKTYSPYNDTDVSTLKEENNTKN